MRIREVTLSEEEQNQPFSEYFERLVKMVSRDAMPEDAALMLQLIRAMERDFFGPDMFVARGLFGFTIQEGYGATAPVLTIMVGKPLKGHLSHGLVYQITNHRNTNQDEKAMPTLHQFNDLDSALSYVAHCLGRERHRH